MNRLLAVVLLIGALGSDAVAEPVRVRSGEHPGFTRVVLQFARPTAWTIGRTGQGYGLRLGRSDVALDLAGAFDLIPRTRITAMSTGPGDTALLIATDCDCHIEAFEDRPGLVVIDLLDGPPSPLSRFETALNGPAGPAAPTRAAAALLADTEPAPGGLLALFWKRTLDPPAPTPAPLQPTQDPVEARAVESPVPEPARQSLRPAGALTPDLRLLDQALAKAALVPAALVPAAPRQLDGVVPQPGTAAADVPDPTFQLHPTSTRIDTARSALLQELSRAASQGLVDVVQAEQPTLQTDPPEPDPAAARPEPPLVANDHVTIMAETSIDRDALLEPASRSVTPDGIACIADAALALPDWGDARPATEQIAERRQALLGEFDAASAASVAAMARLYLFLGFGAEAGETLRAFPVEVPNSDLLAIMGTIIDDGTPDPGRLAAMTDCDGTAALWAVLATPHLVPGQAVDTKSVIRNFSALPLHLRRLLGPRLSNRFLSVGDEATARTIQGAVTRAAGDPGAEARVVDARLDLSQDDKAAAKARLAHVVAEDGPASPEALILLIETQIEQGMTVDKATVDTAAAMAFEHRGTALGSQLARIEVLATAASGHFDGAFATLAVQTNAGPEAMPTELDENLFALLAGKADDATYLRHMFGATDRLIGADLSRGLRQALAGRMVNLGFPDQARAVLAAVPSPKAADRLLLARIALADRDPGAALRSIEGMAAPEAELIRAEALSALGYDAVASGAFAAAGEPAKAASASWRAGDLATAGALGTPEQRAAIGAVAPGLVPVLAPAAGHGAGRSADDLAVDPAEPTTAEALGPLARNRALLAESEATRASLEQLLTAFPPAPGTVQPPATP